MELKFRKLKADEIDCRIQKVYSNGLTLLLYKDARCDQNILDETVGAMNWQRHHNRDNANCIVSIWDSEKNQWVEKEDTGKESRSEKEKGLASDSFKRACFNWGIGRELYTAPFIWIQAKDCNIKDGKCSDRFEVRNIGYTGDRITELVIYNTKQFAICGKTLGALRRNVLSPMQNVLPDMGYEISESRLENKWTVRHGDNVNTFYLFGGKDESSQNLIQGVTLAGVLFDEVALMPESFVNQATARCSVEGSKWWFNCNPSTPFHWFKVNWIDRKEEKNLLYLHFELDDNRSLSEHIKDRYRSMYQGVFYRRYILGEWVAAEGIIYDMFSENRHVTKEKYKPVGNVYVSCDYGIQNATVFLMWAKIKGIWTCIREYCYSGRENLKQKTDAEFVQDMKMWLDGTIPKRIIVDPSATSFIAELRKNGYTVKRGMNDVLDGIRYTSTALGRGELMFVSDCVNTIREFHSYMWDLKSTDAGEDRPLKEHDHCMDAMRYFTYTIMRQEKVKVKGFKEGI